MRHYTVIDRETNELRDTGLSESQVVELHLERGQRSSATSLIRNLRTGQRISIAKIIVRREA